MAPPDRDHLTMQCRSLEDTPVTIEYPLTVTVVETWQWRARRWLGVRLLAAGWRILGAQVTIERTEGTGNEEAR